MHWLTKIADKIMSKCNYTLSKKNNADGKAQVLLRFVGSKTEVWRAKTGIFIKPENWDGDQPHPAHRDQADISECKRTKAKLEALTAFVVKRYNRDKEHGSKWLTSLIDELKWDDNRIVDTFGSDFSDLSLEASCRLMTDTDTTNKTFTPATAQGYRQLADKFQVYESEFGRVRVGDFDTATIERFMEHCRKRYKLADNTMYDLRVKIMRWWRWCMDRDTSLLPMPTTAGRVRGKTYGTPYYLTKEQRDQLYNAKMPNVKIEQVRDAFVLQCLIGCRVSDLMAMTKDNIKGDRIEYIAQKTLHSNPQTISVPLHKTAKEIITKYAGGKNLVNMAYTHETYMRRLRKAIKVSGIDCMITVRDCHTGQPKQVMLSEVASSHMARRTFIGCLYEVGFRESDICSMSGHKEGSLSIQRYRRVSDERKRMMIDAI